MKPYKGFVSNIIGKCILQKKGGFLFVFVFVFVFFLSF